MVDEAWTLTYNGLASGKRAYGQESLLTLGNGYIGWRGATVFTKFDEDHYPGLYVAGVFNQTNTAVAGRDIVNEDMVNMPNPQLFNIYVAGQAVIFNAETIVDRKAQLDFKTGELTEHFSVKVAQGKLTIDSKKVVDPLEYHRFGIALTITADFDGEMTIESLIDGSLLNQNVERYRAFESSEFEIKKIENELMFGQTRTTAIDFVVGAKTYGPTGAFELVKSENPALQMARENFKLSVGRPVKITKVISIATSLEIKVPREQVTNDLVTSSFDDIQKNNRAYWEQVWQKGDISLDSDNPDMQRMIRMNIFHIRQAAQHNANKDLDVSVGSRGLTGEGYRGHIFWDELFVIPYYAANDPATARDLLQYRINRLAAAKKNAIVDGEKGAMFPWQSGQLGDEQAQYIHLNTVNNEWEPDNSRRQRHISLAIVYNMWVYTQLTGDDDFLNQGGLEILFETSKFWLNKAELGDDGRYHIAGVMGPDEYHEGYPEADEGGITDNAYTNLMVTWSLNWLLELQHRSTVNFDTIAEKNDFDSELLKLAEQVAEKLALVINEQGVIAQYAGYFDLKAVDFAKYTEKYGDIHRIDRLLKAEGLSPDDYQVAKQADVLMTIYNLGADKMAQLVKQLGYELPNDWLSINKTYYLERTVHGSTTSRPVFAGIDVSLDNQTEALEYLTTAIGSDYYDIQGGTTAEGVHIGVMGETLEVVQNEFGGVSLRDGKVMIAPRLPESWRMLSFHQQYRGIWLELELTAETVTITADHPITVNVFGHDYMLLANQTELITKG